ncbi:hypothetical protein ACGGZK_15255 [Agromyces sp. MMS24-K17]|uniref:hypothetical protein n=1 Tax=Agromyces sp. MMS24-K17 TaxID=3372850 RepID=UPI0037551782
MITSRRAPSVVALAAGAAALLLVAGLAGCTPGAPEPSPTGASTASPSASAVAPETEAPMTDVPVTPGIGLTPTANAVPLEPGDCPFDPAEFGAIVFVVTASDDTTPIELTFTSFQDGATSERTVEAVGPVVTVLQQDCGNATATGPWTFRATSPTGNDLACSSFYGGKHLASAMDYAEGDVARGASVDCSGHPGM